MYCRNDSSHIYLHTRTGAPRQPLFHQRAYRLDWARPRHLSTLLLPVPTPAAHQGNHHEADQRRTSTFVGKVNTLPAPSDRIPVSHLTNHAASSNSYVQPNLVRRARLPSSHLAKKTPHGQDAACSLCRRRRPAPPGGGARNRKTPREPPVVEHPYQRSFAHLLVGTASHVLAAAPVEGIGCVRERNWDENVR